MPKNVSEAQPASSSEPNSKAQVVSDQPIPEGFFDDPILDAKVGYNIRLYVDTQLG